MYSQRQECLSNLKSVADLELYEKISNFGNERLGHIWGFTPDEILKVTEALILYCVDKGEEPKGEGLEAIGLKRLEWVDADLGVRIDTWAT